MKFSPVILAAGAVILLTGLRAQAEPRTRGGEAVQAVPQSSQDAKKPNGSPNPACSAACQTLPLLASGALTINGSTTVRPITERAETFFQETVFNADITVLAPGSGAGRRALLEGQCARVGGFPSCDYNGDGKVDAPCDIAESSSKMPAAELAFAESHGCCIAEYSVAVDGLGIIVHISNGLPNLNRNQISQIYTNPAVNNYALVGGTPGDIHVYSRKPPSGTFDSFLALYITPETASPLLPACGGSPATSCITFLESNDQIAAAVGNDPAGLGYVGVGFLGANSNIRSLPVRKTAADNPVAASFQTVQDGTFQFKRDLYYYTCGVAVPGIGSGGSEDQDSDDARGGRPGKSGRSQGDLRGLFIDYVLSRAGQSLVAQSGFVPHYLINQVGSHEQVLLEPGINRVVNRDGVRIQETLDELAQLNSPADDNLIAELKSFLHEQFLGDHAIIKVVVDRAVTCAADPTRAVQAQTALADAEAAAKANPPDWPASNAFLVEALSLAQQALR